MCPLYQRGQVLIRAPAAEGAVVNNDRSRSRVILQRRKHLQDLLIQNGCSVICFVPRVGLHAGQDHDHRPQHSNCEHNHGDDKLEQRHSTLTESRSMPGAPHSNVWRLRHCVSPSVPLYPIATAIAGPSLHVSARGYCDCSPIQTLPCGTTLLWCYRHHPQRTHSDMELAWQWLFDTTVTRD